MIIAALDSAGPSLVCSDVLLLVVLSESPPTGRPPLLGWVVLDGLAWCYERVVVDVVHVVGVVVGVDVGVVVVVLAVVDVVVDVAAGVVAVAVDDFGACARSLVGSTTQKRKSKRATLAENRHNGMA
jgi:hypothetical protein